MQLKQILTLFFLFNVALSCLGQKKISVKDFGAKGDGETDDWTSIQKTIDYALIKNIDSVFFPKGKYVVKDRTLIIWGSNLKLIGEDKNSTIILREGRPGWWGETLHISGKLPDRKYYGGFGTLKSYDSFVFYRGPRVLSKNIEISNLSIDSQLNYPERSNNIGITNARNVVIKNCVIRNAPQTNIAVVNDTFKSDNDSIKIVDCLLESSGQHNMRVISYNQGQYIRNKVIIENSIFRNVKSVDLNKEIFGRKVHIWYRAGVGGTGISLEINNSTFDSTGDIITTVNGSNLTIRNSRVDGVIDISQSRLYDKPIIILENNSFKKPIIQAIKLKNAKPTLRNNKYF